MMLTCVSLSSGCTSNCCIDSMIGIFSLAVRKVHVSRQNGGPIEDLHGVVNIEGEGNVK